MYLLLSFIISFSVSTLIIIILSSRYKGKEKVDKGSALLYYKLSYRRKMIRTLWSIPFVFIATYLLYWMLELSVGMTILITILFLLLTFAQAAYNYVMWQKKEAA
ncbi:hypothetical protein [Jeotgalibacillus proteolyticus]|uniref:hypothetical protein n=1 Tax=Jeotgalibacillus proteolyticus TaxID=2082395 RepID=UPI003CF9B4B4